MTWAQHDTLGGRWSSGPTVCRQEATVTTLEERFQASQPVLARLGRADANGIPLGNAMMAEIAPDQWRIIWEACFGVLWTRLGLTMEQRSLATISIITVLRRDDNLKGHIHSGLDVGLTAEQIVEVMLQLIFYTGAPIANTALRIACDVFKERGIQAAPTRSTIRKKTRRCCIAEE